MEPTSSPRSGRSAREAARRGADAIRHSRSSAPSNRDRQAGHRKPDHSLRQATPCSQSQIGGGRHLRSWRAAQVEGAVALSVVVRSGPIMTAMNGTVVARPEDNLGQACRCWGHLDHRVSAIRGNHGCMGKPLQTARQLFRMPSGRGRMGRWLRRPAELGSSRPGSTVGSTCRFSRRPRLGTLSRHLYCGHFDARRGKGSASLHSMDAAGRCHIQLLPSRT
jgi:hypothetical protein